MPRGVARDHAEKRAAIRKAAAAYFASRGYGQASMAGAARAAGVSKALIYHYWPGKDALLSDILDAHLADLAEVAEAATSQGLRALVRAILAAYRDADAEHKLQADALATLAPEAQAPLREYQRRIVAAMEAALSAEGLARGDRLRPTAMAVFGMLNWFYMWHRPGSAVSREDYADLVADLALGGLPQVSSSV